jgi:hypothetical protein
MNTEIKTYTQALVGTYIGSGTKLHLVEAVIDGNKYAMWSVTCGSNRGLGNGRHMQHGIVELGARYETTSVMGWAEKCDAQSPTLAGAAEALEAQPNACEKCLKEAKRLAAFRAGVAA